MSRISSDMLTDTLNLISLARQTALSKGEQAQAGQFTPVETRLRALVTEARESKPVAPSSCLMEQSDFQTLLAATQAAPQPAGQSRSQPASQLS